MATSPNQRTLVGIQKEICDQDHIYAKINKNALFEAIKNLPGSELSMWLYFASQSENIKNFPFGPTSIFEAIGLSKNTYKGAFNGLRDKGYFVQTSSNHFRFYELPQSINNTMEQTQVKNDTMILQGKNDPIDSSQGKNDLIEVSQDKINTMISYGKNDLIEQSQGKNNTMAIVIDGKEFVF